MAYLSKGFLTRFVNFVKGTRVNGYDTSKDRFKREATRILKEVAARMGLPKCSFEVRFNPGGPAVSGDPIFHGERVYANLSQFGEGFYYRSCAGRKDYTGGYKIQDVRRVCRARPEPVGVAGGHIHRQFRGRRKAMSICSSCAA